MWRRLRGAIGAVALVLLGVMLTVSFRDASANGASYLAAIGITGVPGFLQTPTAGLVLAIILTAIPSVLITRWWMRRPPNTAADTSPSDYDLYTSMDYLVARMTEYLEYEGFLIGPDNNPNTILMDCNSLNLTLRKNGFEVPYVPSGEARAMFNTLSNYYRRVGPLLRDGHAIEARQLAHQLARQHPAPGQIVARQEL